MSLKLDGELFENDVEDKFEKIDSEEEQDHIEDSADDDDDYDMENSFENDAKGRPCVFYSIWMTLFYFILFYFCHFN